MKQILHLFKLQIDNKMNIFKTKDVKAFLLSLIKGLGIILLGTFAASYIFGYVKSIGLWFNESFLGVLILLVTVISFFLSLGSIISGLYLSKENELLLSLPATQTQVYISKFLVLYVYELITTALFTLPLLFAFGMEANGISVWFYLCCPLFLLFLPLIPMALAALVSIPFTLLIRFLRNKPKTSITIILLLGAVLFYFYMSFVGGFADVINLTGQQIQTMLEANNAIYNVGQWALIKYMAQMFLLEGVAIRLLSLIGAGLFLFVISVIIVRPFFFKIATMQAETSTKTPKKPTQTASEPDNSFTGKVKKLFAEKEKKYKSDTAFISLIKKEALTIFRSADMVFQFFLFTILMPFIVYTYDKLLLSIAVTQAGDVMIMGAHILIVSVMAMLTNIISASAISREGGNAYLFKITPTSFEKQAFAKLTFNAMFSLGAIFITTISTLIFMPSLNPFGVIFGSIAVMIVSIGHICWSFDMDLRNPTLDWYSASDITKVNKNTALSLTYGLAIAFISGMLVISFSGSGLWFPLILFALVGSFFTYKRIQWLILRLELYFNKMEL